MAETLTARSSSVRRSISVNDRMQQGYFYHLTEPIGTNFREDFKPELTPQEMLELGVFGGKYLNDCRAEFPFSWFAKAKLSPFKKDPSLNFFGVDASSSLEEWRRNGWIHEDDPRGWFQWYCRYFLGRRHDDDNRQIGRWKSYRRHWTQLVRNCDVGDFRCRPKQRQSLLHWAYDSRKI